jgi:hypothetical protein
MNPQEMYAVWAPESAPWSTWAKPVIFAQFRPGPLNIETDGAAQISWQTRLTQLLPPLGTHAAIVVNLPGADALQMGLLLAQRGYRPIPLFNACSGDRRPAVDMHRMMTQLPHVSLELSRLQIPWEAPPAFLIDSDRCPRLAPMPGNFDNRWLVFPQDFPSARFLQDHGIDTVVLLENIQGLLQEDLAHVFLRWQLAGIALHHFSLTGGAGPQPLQVTKPSWFRFLAYRAMVLMGFRRSSAGGFGSLVPEPGSGGG